ncbi:coiled-coil and C2 domain-containing protein 2A [Halyomorpha halys]|uniref:coiled-coil and C2 domain-containing protein 2A n=1 Tax=Halyomorpha halys TaxID=286706 RepID=UPI0006D4DCFC|nr:coiled-coil and C2 domain-containing protein 2A [Halyomorpha halys]
MSDQGKLLSENIKDESTPEKWPIPRPRSGIRSEIPKSSAWSEDDDHEIVSFSVQAEVTSVPKETSFSHSPTAESHKTTPGEISPARSSVPSSPARSDTEFIKKKAFFVSPMATKHQNTESPDIRRKPDTGESSGKISEISSIKSGTSISDNKTYREKIRERVQAAKERAMAAGAFKTKMPRIKSPTDSKSEEFDKDEDKVEEALKKHKEIRSKWKVATASVHVANIQSGYEFFSKGWEAPIKSSLEENDSEDAEQPPKGESSDDEKLLVKDILGSREGDWFPLYNHLAPELTDWSAVKEKQVGLFFCPSTSPVPIEEKLEQETSPRFIEDEGLYVGKRTKVSWKRRNKLEQRIMAMGSEKFWFGEDGEIRGIQDPLEYSSFNIYLDDEVPPELQVEYVPAKKDKPGALSATGDEVYLLEIEVGHIVFRHHPLFSRENCIAERLRSLCEVKESPAVRIGGKLQAIRNSRDHLLKLYGVTEDQSLLERANRLSKEVKTIRIEWLQEKKKERQHLKNILETWRDLKIIREKQGYISSIYKLRIVSREEDDHDWDNEFKAYLNEQLEEAEEQYKSEMEEYEEKLKKWNKLKQKKEEGISSEDEVESCPEEELKEPTKPKKLRVSTLETTIKEELSECLRPPGEPAIEVYLLEDLNITQNTESAMEEERRKVMKQCQIAVSLQVNGKQVDKATGTPIDEMFSSHLNHRFCLKLQSQPSSLSLQITEAGHPNLFGKKNIAQIFIPIPGRINTDSAEWCDYEFSCGERVGPFKHTGMGCGQLESNVGEEKTLYTNGLLAVRAGWADPLPNILHQPKPNKVTKPSQNNIQKLKEWVEQVQLDPNDPNNADLFEYLKTAENKEPKTNSSNIMEFCSEEEIFENPRLKLLMLRHAGQPEFRTMRMIPLNEREIPKDIFKLYEKRISGRQKKSKGGSLEQERAWAKEYIEQVKEEVLKKSKLNQAKTFTDMIHEEPVPDLGTLGLTFMKFLQPKRPLRPRRKKRKKYPVKSLAGQQLEIIINIGRAFEVPVRKDANERSNEESFSVVPVRPFIEVTFQGERRRTNTAEGANPTWNQDLHIPIENPHPSFNPAALQSFKESIHIHLFDEKLVDIIDDDRLRETNIHQRLEKHWLASLRIPFAALYSNTRIEGTFQMYSPPVLLSYERESKEFRDSTFLTVFLIVHPPLHPPSPLQEKIESSEEVYLEQHLEHWLGEVKKAFPNRYVPALVMDSSGRSVCVTRFFKDIKPPEISPDVNTTPEMAARYVAMIPIISGNMLYPGYLDVWLTADQVLGLGTCESCSAATLLACFMRGLGLQTWLLVGSSLASGPVLYILARSTRGETTIWDPSTGRCYPTSHPFSPLYRVYCLIDDTNIWVNNQKDDLLSSTSLDLTKRSDWWPAFGRSVGAPVGSVQPNSLVYKPTYDTRALESRLEKILRNAIMKLRPSSRTIWNRYCSSSLKKLLPGLEKAAWSGESNSTSDHIQELQHILASYKMSGFPINMPYSSPSELVDAVKSTGVHMNDAPEIEFSIAVYIHPFPNNVISVWVYVASLIRRR